MKRKTIIALTVAAASLILSGCSAISTGTITGKEHHASYTTTSMSCAMYRKGSCSMYLPHTYYHPERWVLDLKKGDKTGWVDVEHDVYDGANVGNEYGAKNE